MIEEILIQYGVAGVMLVYFIVDKAKFQTGLAKVIQNNTIALTKVHSVITKCQKR